MFPNCIFYLRKENVDNELLELVVKNMIYNSNTYILNGMKYGNHLATAMGCVDGEEVVMLKSDHCGMETGLHYNYLNPH